MISAHFRGWAVRNSHWYWCVPAVLKSFWDDIGSHQLISPSYSDSWAVHSTLPPFSPARCNGWVILFSLHERNGLFSPDHQFSSHFLPVHSNGQFSFSEIRLVRYNWCIRLRLNNKYILTCTYHETTTTVYRFIILNCFFLLYFCSHASFSLPCPKKTTNLFSASGLQVLKFFRHVTYCDEVLLTSHINFDICCYIGISPFIIEWYPTIGTCWNSSVYTVAWHSQLCQTRLL